MRAKHSVVSVMYHLSVVGRSRWKDLLPRGQHLVCIFEYISAGLFAVHEVPVFQMLTVFNDDL